MVIDTAAKGQERTIRLGNHAQAALRLDLLGCAMMCQHLLIGQ